jgi:acetoin utilization deacetylase AcuC-like enzyme
MRTDIEPDDIYARLGLYAMDTATPLTAGTWIAAKTGADCAINAAHALRLGENGTFALTRPPGQHAGADYFGSACFLNNAALAAQHLLDDGVKRVAILDIGAQHGSGTQAIFYARKDVLVTSIHADPRTRAPFYSGHADEAGTGDGLGCNLNVPLAPDTTAAQWFAAFETACLKISMSGAEALVVSLGVDTFGGDPASTFALASGDFLRLGERIAHLGLPAVFVLEGGSVTAELGINVVNVLEGFETAN